MTRHIADKLYKLYNTRYLTALILIATLFSVDFFIAKLVITQQEDTYAVVNVSGRQRMLSQRINAMAASTINATSAADKITAKNRLKDAAALFSSSHRDLIQGNESLGLQPLTDESIQEVYFGEEQLNLQVLEYLNLVDFVLTNENEEEVRRTAAEISERAEQILISLDHVVSLHELIGNTALERLNLLLTVILVISLSFLLLVGIFIFAPAGRRLKLAVHDQANANISLREQRDEFEALSAEHEAAKNIAEAERRRAEKSDEAKGRFLAMMSHELRTPLTAILGFGILVKSDLENKDEIETSKIKGFISTIIDSGNHLLAIVNDVLDFASFEEGEIKLKIVPFNLIDCMQSVKTMTEAQCLENKVKLHIETETSLPQFILSDEGRLRQILINLVSNAIKFSKNTDVKIIARTEDANDGKIKLYIDVVDSGIGIPKDKLEAIFNPFEQVDSGNQRAYGGTGLGLAITKSITKALGGQIWVESEEGKGTTMHLYITTQEAKDAQ